MLGFLTIKGDHEVSMYLPNPFSMSHMQHKDNFQVEYSWFEFKVFFILLLDWLLYQDWRIQPLYSLPISGGELMDSCLSQKL